MVRGRRLAAAVTLCAVLALGAACGKKIMPQPQDNRELFSWRGVTATATENGCLTARGEAQGNVDNMASVILEIQPIDGSADSCAGCPFQATARQEFWPEKQITPQGTAIVEVTMCPDRKAPAYRWRLVGLNVLTRFAHALGKVQTLVVDPNAPGFELPVDDTRPQQQTEIVIP
uniref:Lipoprotein n=1 Tax=Nitratidesulfovibrio vulgaris (strain DSM 19637 / Miyazaki F) TaxID=883 RepID=B8DJI9_NITV9